jgi:hypothetical protein
MTRTTFLLPVVFLFLLTVTQFARAAPVILFDQSHGQRFLVEENRPLDLSGLARIFADHGGKIRTGRKPLSESVLQGVDVLIISGLFQPVAEKEVSAIMGFVHRGGRLALMAHISSPLTSLLEQLGIRISTRPVSEQENVISENPRNFKLTRLGRHPLTHDLAAINIYGGWALLDRDGNLTAIAATGDRAWVDLNGDGRSGRGDAVQSFSMVLAGKVGKGDFVVFGDDAVFQNQFLKNDNHKLAENLARWFIGNAGGELI